MRGVLIFAMFVACSRTQLDDGLPAGDEGADGAVSVANTDASDAADVRSEAADLGPCAPAVLVDAISPIAMVLDGDWIYFSDGAPSYSVARVSKKGGAYKRLSDTWSYGMAVDDTYLYWTWTVSSPVSYGTVRRVPKAGGATEIFASWQGTAGAITVDATALYVADSGLIWKIRKSDGALQQLAQYKQATGLAVLGSDLFIADWTTGLNRVGTDGSNPTKLHASQYARFIAVQPGYVFWQDIDGLWVEDLAQLTATSLASSSNGIAVDDTNVYWSANTEIHRAPKLGGGPVTVMGKSTLSTGNVAVDDACLFYTTEGNAGQIIRSPK